MISSSKLSVRVGKLWGISPRGSQNWSK